MAKNSCAGCYLASCENNDGQGPPEASGKCRLLPLVVAVMLDTEVPFGDGYPVRALCMSTYVK